MNDESLTIFTSIAAFAGWSLLAILWWIEWVYRNNHPMFSVWSTKEKIWIVVFHLFVIAVTAFAFIG